MQLHSSSFADGRPMPRRHGYKHGNISPDIRVSGLPGGCRSVALIMDDPDAMKPAGRVWVHWLVWNVLPGADLGCRIGEGAGADTEGITDFGETGYGGPAPPDRRHTYIFKAYALDAVLGLQKGATKGQLENAMRGHVLETAALTGTFKP